MRGAGSNVKIVGNAGLLEERLPVLIVGLAIGGYHLVRRAQGGISRLLNYNLEWRLIVRFDAERRIRLALGRARPFWLGKNFDALGNLGTRRPKKPRALMALPPEAKRRSTDLVSGLTAGELAWRAKLTAEEMAPSLIN